MSPYRLPDHIHFCAIGTERVFLDLVADTYFSLPPETDAAFSRLLREPDARSSPAEEVDLLLRAGILVAAPEGRPLAATSHPRPERSLVELAPAAPRVSLAAVAETWWLVQRSRRAVARKALPRLLPSLHAPRPRGAALSAEARDRAVALFRAARRLVPAAPGCLHDSIALRLFLRRRGVAADLVIGAKLYPFGAHCWLQDGDLVLNDTLAAARDFTPLLVA
jgi:hypothetical protein